MTYKQYLEAVGENGAIFVGDSNTVANKIIKTMENLGLNSFYLHLPIVSMPHEDRLTIFSSYIFNILRNLSNILSSIL